MKSRLRILLTLAVFAAALITSSPVTAQDATPVVSDDEVNAVAQDLFCPVCENTPLDVCPTKACAQWRELIREKIALGWNEQQIQEYFAEQYGEQVLAVPPREGLNWIVYILPPLVVIVGVLLALNVLRRPKKYSSAGNKKPFTSPTMPSKGVMDEIENDLQRDDQK